MNIVYDHYGTIGGGDDNIAGNSGTPVTSEPYATVGGGHLNHAQGAHSTIGGGEGNYVSGARATIGGGESNQASGDYATIAGGYFNQANGLMSFAAGNLALANRPGCFVWADDTRTSNTGCWLDHQWLTVTTGGTWIYTNTAGTTGVYVAAGSGTWSSASDRELKRDIQSVDDGDILDRVSRLEISSWSYNDEGHVRHIGPMAQDFYAEFGVGDSDRSIAVVDADGIALAAIRALQKRVVSLEQENQLLSARLAAIESKLGLGTRP